MCAFRPERSFDRMFDSVRNVAITSRSARVRAERLLFYLTNSPSRPVTDGQSLREQTFNVNLWGASRIVAKRSNERHIRRFGF
jgi:hypothetical protein